MPNPNSFWIVSFRPDSDESFSELQERILGLTPEKLSSSSPPPLAQLTAPDFKIAPLATLIRLSETLSKHEAFANQALQRIVETLKTLLASKPSAFLRKTPASSAPQSELEDNLLMDDGRSYETYLFKNWEWNRGKYNRVENRTLEELVETLLKDVVTVENSHKLKLASYNQAKAQCAALRRKRNGNLSVKSLAEFVTLQHFVDPTSEFLETLLVAVPNTHSKDWRNSYEHLTPLVVPRSSIKIAEDEEFTLFNVTIFKKIKEQFAQKCREHKFVVREFVFDQTEIEKALFEQKEFEQQEKDLWSELLRLSRINFSDTFQAIVHLKVIQTHVESLLRYGLPPHFCTVVLKAESRSSKKLLNQLTAFHDSLESNESDSKKKKPNHSKLKVAHSSDETIGGEYAGLLEQEVFDFVLFEVINPKQDVKEVQK